MIKFLLLISIFTVQLFGKTVPVGKDDDSITLVKSTVQSPNFIQPWRSKNPETKRAFGVYIGDGLILTTADTVYYATSIEIQKFGSLKNYTAKIVRLEPDLGLALLKIEESDFSSNLKAVHFSAETFLPSNGILFEYKDYRNLEEKKVKSTKIDIDTYTNGYVELPYIEIQSDEKLEGNGELIIEESSRIAQGIIISFKDSQNTGKLIPGFMIKRFIECVGEESCIPFKGFRFRPMTDRSTREFYGVKKEDQGVLVAEIYPNSDDLKIFHLEDVILEVAGYKIDPKGFFDHPKFGKIAMSFLFHGSEEFLNKSSKISVKILRNRKLLLIDVNQRSFNEKNIKIPFGNTRNRKPEYLLLGGIVFQELSEQFLMEFGAQWRSKVNKLLLYLNDFHHTAVNQKEGKYLVLTQVLPLTGNQAYHSLHQIVLESINGITPSDLRDLKQIVSANKKEFLVFQFTDGSQVIFKQEEIQKLNDEAMSTFRIPAAQNF